MNTLESLEKRSNELNQIHKHRSWTREEIQEIKEIYDKKQKLDKKPR